jgi:AraC family transcriptional regulator, regulatory protein of adaptative response / methylated-DNA-[protein]-cysteine methyltransferase
MIMKKYSLHPRVLLDPASPDEIKSGGAGWVLAAGFGPSPFGQCLLAQSPRGLCHLSFVDASPSAAWKEMTRLWPNAEWRRDDAAAAKTLESLFPGPNAPALPRRWTAFVKGTAFQVKVWRALLEIKPGQLTHYGVVAEAVGTPTAARAVGSAVGRNELAWLIPCHRVIRKTSALGGYRWGHDRKQAMIAWEAAQAN